jgi:hypothetical protein
MDTNTVVEEFEFKAMGPEKRSAVKSAPPQKPKEIELKAEIPELKVDNIIEEPNNKK